MLTAARERGKSVRQSIAELRRLDRKKAYEMDALLEAQRLARHSMSVEATGRAVGVIAHDLDNALTSILGLSSLLEAEDYASDEDIRDAS